MDISTFRLILVVAGVAIIAGIFLFGNPDRKRKPRASRKRIHAARVRREPVMDTEQDANGQPADTDDDVDSRQTELAIDGGGRDGDRFEPALEPGAGARSRAGARAADVPMPDKIITLFLQVRDNNFISGVELLDASLKSGLVFGEHNIFHRINEEDTDPIFSMANLTNPGSFDKLAWNILEIKGVTMFMALPGPRNALDAWDSMLATSRRLAELLHADLLDDTHSTFTRQRSLQIKEELREYERNKKDQS